MMKIEDIERSETLIRDVAQVCENGHVVNSFSNSATQKNHNFCPTCGAKTQTQCTNCNNPIPGGLRHLGLTEPGENEPRTILKEPAQSIPSHCTNCGQKFPWAGKTHSTKKENQSTNQLGSLAVVGSGNIIQFQSPNSSQAASVSKLKIEETVKKLNELVEQCSASGLDKEEATAALERVRQLAEKPKSAEVLARANEKLELVKNTIGTAVELSKIATPYIAILANHFAG